MNCNPAYFVNKIRSDQSCQTYRLAAAVIAIGFIFFASVAGILLIRTEHLKNNAVKITKLFEQFNVQEDLWETLISANPKDDPTSMRNMIDKKFDESFYNKARSYKTTHKYEMPTDLADNFSQYSDQIQFAIYRVLHGMFLEFWNTTKSPLLIGCSTPSNVLPFLLQLKPGLQSAPVSLR